MLGTKMHQQPGQRYERSSAVFARQRPFAQTVVRFNAQQQFFVADLAFLNRMLVEQVRTKMAQVVQSDFAYKALKTRPVGIMSSPLIVRCRGMDVGHVLFQFLRIFWRIWTLWAPVPTWLEQRKRHVLFLCRLFRISRRWALTSARMLSQVNRRLCYKQALWAFEVCLTVSVSMLFKAFLRSKLFAAFLTGKFYTKKSNKFHRN